jgi:hypothetical protein
MERANLGRELSMKDAAAVALRWRWREDSARAGSREEGALESGERGGGREEADLHAGSMSKGS